MNPVPGNDHTSDPRSPAPPLDEAERARGRRLAIGSHLPGMVFTTAFSGHLATLALVSLGAGEALVGLYKGLSEAATLLKLPTLRAVAVHSKRRILVGGHLAALIAAAPLLAFSTLANADGNTGLVVVFTSLVAVAAAVSVWSTVWFPLLRGYVEPERIGAFFGTLRTSWHVTLIAYFVLATLWLAEHDGSYGPLFALAWCLGVVRTFVIVRLPERDERTGDRIRIGEALALIRAQAPLRRYLIGVTWHAAVQKSVVPFTIVMLRRELGLSSAEIIYMTVATFAGGLASLYLWGRIVDRVGASPVFITTSIGPALLYACLAGVEGAGEHLVAAMVGFFFLHAVLTAGHGVADTRVLFDLTPPDAPARTLVIASVFASVLSAVGPIAAGITLDAMLTDNASPLSAYRGFFIAAAMLQAASFWPLRGFGPRRS